MTSNFSHTFIYHPFRPPVNIQIILFPIHNITSLMYMPCLCFQIQPLRISLMLNEDLNCKMTASPFKSQWQKAVYYLIQWLTRVQSKYLMGYWKCYCCMSQKQDLQSKSIWTTGQICGERLFSLQCRHTLPK